MITCADVTPSTLTDILDKAALDWTLLPAGGVYVHSDRLPFWVDVHEPSRSLHFHSYWALRSDESEYAALTLANRCNARLALVQFYVTPDLGRLYGYYLMSISEGLFPRQFLRMARSFEEAFSLSVHEYDVDHVLADNAAGVLRNNDPVESQPSLLN